MSLVIRCCGLGTAVETQEPPRYAWPVAGAAGFGVDASGLREALTSTSWGGGRVVPSRRITGGTGTDAAMGAGGVGAGCGLGLGGGGMEIREP